MSIQDESFPHDELFEVDLSPTPLNRFQFPHRLRERQQQKLYSGEVPKSPLTMMHNLNISSSSADQTISSAESATEQPGNAAMQNNNRMIKSDQTGLANTGERRVQLLGGDRKSQSYQEIHSEYTKRRYKHVESKVGQYIANIRNEDERRRKLARFQRHRSMPVELVHDPQALKRLQLQRGVTNIADNLSQALVRVIDGVENEDDETEQEASADLSVSNLTALTSATMSTQSGSGGAADDDEDDDDSENNHRRQTDESGESRLCDTHKVGVVNKATYALLLDERDRLQSYNDYQQLKLDEKQSEITRLRQNVDFLRVRLSTAEDQLKRNVSGRYTMNGMTSGSFGYSQPSTSGMSYWGTGRQSLQGLLYCAAKTTKATQTEFEYHSPPPPPPPSPSPLHVGLPHNELQSFVTPDTPDANNNHCVEGTLEGCERNVKSVAAIQPMSLNFSNYTVAESAELRSATDNVTLRKRSNSIKFRQTAVERVATHHSDKSQHNSRTSQPSSSDSAIDVEVIELYSSPKPARRKRYMVELSEDVTFAPNVRSLHYDRDQRTPSPSGLYITHCPNSTPMDISTVVDNTQGARRSTLKKCGGASDRSISRRWLRLFASCIRCRNPRQTDREQFALQQTYTQIPLLETTFDKSAIPLASN
ncbi:protein swallow [Bactrocera oleae]|uniref:protein swallow n=1 Tax=Bactrocera oleae TaxID=104688 RepID=UPI00387E4C93